jgi:uridine kinase
MVTSRLPWAEAAAPRLVASVLASPPSLDGGRLVCVDGPSGAGKTTLAAALGRRLRDALRLPGAAERAPVRLIHMDDLYAGWDGLAAGMATLADDVIGPLRHGQPGRYRRYDWHRAVFAEEQLVEPCEVLLVEGVGAAPAACADVVTCLVWVDAPSDVRLARGVRRDGTAARGPLLRWRAQEEAMFARERTRQRADVVVDGTRST